MLKPSEARCEQNLKKMEIRVKFTGSAEKKSVSTSEPYHFCCSHTHARFHVTSLREILYVKERLLYVWTDIIRCEIRWI